MKHRIDTSKVLFYTVTICMVIGLSFAFGLYSGSKKTIAYEAVRNLKTAIELALHTTSEEVSTLTKTHPTHFLQPARFEGDGVTVNLTPEDDSLVFLSGFFENDNGLRLIRRDGTVLASWTVNFSEIFTDTSHLEVPPATDWNVDIHGALILPDGSIVFNFEPYGLAKLNRCGEIVWTLAEQTHHSIERAEGGGFWVPGSRHYPEGSNSPFPPFKTPFVAHTIMKVSEDGEVLLEAMVPQLFYENGLETLLTSTGEIITARSKWDTEIVHLNKIDELTSDIASDFPMFEAGDLLLSMRQYNLIMVVDPDTGKVKWWKVGPWIRQHDPEFKPGGTITVFNNNIYRTAYGTGPDISTPDIERISNIIEIDPVSNKHNIIYGNKNGQEMLSVIRGKHELTLNGGLLITEFEGGRVFEVDTTGHIIWEYINRYSSEEVAEITEARAYPSNYFSVSDWRCD